jgi:hypothetical protein
MKKTLKVIAEFYDKRKVGDVGHLGFRRSSELSKLLSGLDRLLEEGIIIPDKTLFLDLGCADGRVNVFLSYLVKVSVGIELDEWTINEYSALKSELVGHLIKDSLVLPGKNIYLFHGDSMDNHVHHKLKQETGCALADFDLFYTYLVMHEEFADLIAREAKSGSFYMVYGLEKILPRYNGLRLLHHLSPMEGILAIYQKE